MQPNNPYGPAAPPPQPHEYEFITNSGNTSRKPLSILPSGSSTPVRIAIVVGGLLALLILFIIIKGLLSGGGNTPALINVAQDQQQIIHIVTNANEQTQTSLSGTNQNFAVTAQAALTSAQAQLVTYTANNGHKVGAKTLSLKLSSNLDSELTTAATNSTYDSTFKETMQTQLTDYQQALRAAYAQTTPRGP